MKFQARRILSYAAGALVVGLMLASNAAPAQAAAPLVVDSLGRCGGTFQTIQDAVTFAAAKPNWATAQVKTISVCTGLYQGPIVINGGNNVRLIARKDVFITTDGSNPYSQPIINVTNSTNVRVQGFIIDGRSLVATTYGLAAIRFSESSGVISKNTILHWNSSLFPSARADFGIWATGSGGQKVTISGNTLRDVDQGGIVADGQITARITGNKVTSTTTHYLTGATGISMQYGATGIVSGNKLTGSAFPPGAGSFLGIRLQNVNGVKAINNQATGCTLGISIYGMGGATNDNVVSGNRISNCGMGIILSVISGYTADGEANNNRITGNKITNKKAAPGNRGIELGVYDQNGYLGYGLNEVIMNNTITYFNTGIDRTYCTVPKCTVTIKKNKIKP